MSTGIPDVVVDYVQRLGRAGDDSPGIGSDVVPDTIRLLKERVADSRRIYYLAFDTNTGQSWRYMIATDQVAANGDVKVCGSAGGSGRLDHQRPWANLGYSWGAGALYAAGDVVGTGADQAAAVALTFADRTATDTIDDGVVAFIVDTNDPPTLQRILDQAGNVIAEHPAP